MKFMLISAFLMFQLSADAQTLVPIKNVNGVATFESKVEVPGLSAERIYTRTLKWTETTLLSENVITLNTPAKITARFFKNYTDGTWSDKIEHNVQIDINGTTATFTITDTKLGLINNDGSWKASLANRKAMYEQVANELFLSYEAIIKK